MKLAPIIFVIAPFFAVACKEGPMPADSAASTIERLPNAFQNIATLTHLSSTEVWELPKAAHSNPNLVKAAQDHFSLHPHSLESIDTSRFNKTHLWTVVVDANQSLSHYILSVDGVRGLMVVYTFDEGAKAWKGRALIAP